ncbi:MAG: hypothetical protein IPP52_01160 [Ignavibacteria bacterium]|nr:hypothetical protein [Ignavibacteria bacterium]
MNTEKVNTVFENNENSAITKSSKSPGLALLFSLVLREQDIIILTEWM